MDTPCGAIPSYTVPQSLQMGRVRDVDERAKGAAENGFDAPVCHQ